LKLVHSFDGEDKKLHTEFSEENSWNVEPLQDREVDEDNIEMDLRKIGYVVGSWLKLTLVCV
jgi:hypothetical protein